LTMTLSRRFQNEANTRPGERGERGFEKTKPTSCQGSTKVFVPDGTHNFGITRVDGAGLSRGGERIAGKRRKWGLLA
jgi:hypothetical protein